MGYAPSEVVSQSEFLEDVWETVAMVEWPGKVAI